MGQGWGEEGKEEVKTVTFPTLLTMIVGVKQRHENTTPYKRDANVVPEEQNANNNQEIYKNSESDLQEPLSIDKQDETVGIIKESILQRYEIAKETPNRSEATNSKKKKNERHAKSVIGTANKAILSHQPDKRPIWKTVSHKHQPSCVCNCHYCQRTTGNKNKKEQQAEKTSPTKMEKEN